MKFHFKKYSWFYFKTSLIDMTDLDYPDGYTKPSAGCTNLLFSSFFPKNCMDFSKIGLREGACPSYPLGSANVIKSPIDCGELTLSFMISAATKSVVGALTEYRCYDTMNGLYALPEGIVLDRTQHESQTPSEYVDQLFVRVATMQALELTEFDEHLLKSIALFNPGTRSKNPKKAFPQDSYRPAC